MEKKLSFETEKPRSRCGHIGSVHSWLRKKIKIKITNKRVRLAYPVGCAQSGMIAYLLLQSHPCTYSPDPPDYALHMPFAQPGEAEKVTGLDAYQAYWHPNLRENLVGSYSTRSI